MFFAFIHPAPEALGVAFVFIDALLELFVGVLCFLLVDHVFDVRAYLFSIWLSIWR
jgi:hypothetical protein